MTEISEKKRAKKGIKGSSFIMRITPERRQRLMELATHHNITMTDLVSRMIDVAWKSKEDKL